MARLSLGVVALLVAAIPAMAWSLVSSMEALEQQHEEEDNTLWRTGSRRNLRADDKEGRRNIRELHADQDPTVRWFIKGQSDLSGAGAQGQGVSHRDDLNRLVETSVASTDDQEGNIAFVKTHKTGSTSLAAILYRYAVRHGLKIARVGTGTGVNLKRLAAKVQKGQLQRVDIMHYHIADKGRLPGTWSEAYENYRGIMRDPDSINFITVMREPRSHFLSYYYYYFNPINKLSLEEFLMKEPRNSDHFNLLRNPLSAEFGVTTLVQMEQLTTHGLPSFKLIFLTARFDEGLMVLRRLLGWSMIDMTYMTLNETKAGSKRWDGKPLVDRPSFDDLPEKVQNKIDELTVLDQLLYAAAQKEYAKRLQSMSNVIGADLVAFNELQGVISDYLDANDSSQANELYRAMDVYGEAPPLNPF